MIEPEMAFYDINDNMDLAEDLIKYLIRYALEHNSDDLQFLNDMFDKELLQRLKSVLSDAFVRLSYTEAIKILMQSKQKFEFPVSWGVDLHRNMNVIWWKNIFLNRLFLPIILKLSKHFI
jgi:asparaginyl-tRNA synthetase